MNERDSTEVDGIQHYNCHYSVFSVSVNSPTEYKWKIHTESINGNYSDADASSNGLRMWANDIVSVSACATDKALSVCAHFNFLPAHTIVRMLWPIVVQLYVNVWTLNTRQQRAPNALRLISPTACIWSNSNKFRRTAIFHSCFALN